MIFIAEFGSNPAAYGWDFKRFCEAARRAGAAYGKVQLWQTDLLYPEHMRENRRPLEFPRERYPEFIEECWRADLVPMASVFDEDAVDVVIKHGGFLKLAASRWDKADLLAYTREAVLQAGRLPLYRTTPDLIADREWKVGGGQVNLYTVPEYPVPMGRAIEAVIDASDAFSGAGQNDEWGWSSHTAAPGWVDVALADYLGAHYCEKHFCLSHDDPEGAHSLTESEFEHLVNRINHDGAHIRALKGDAR